MMTTLGSMQKSTEIEWTFFLSYINLDDTYKLKEITVHIYFNRQKKFLGAVDKIERRVNWENPKLAFYL